MMKIMITTTAMMAVLSVINNSCSSSKRNEIILFALISLLITLGKIMHYTVCRLHVPIHRESGMAEGFHVYIYICGFLLHF